MWMWVRSQTLPEGQRGRLDVCGKDARCIVNVPKLIDQGYLDRKHLNYALNRCSDKLPELLSNASQLQVDAGDSRLS